MLINAAWGLGENVVQGTVDPDEYQVFKPLLTDPALSPIIEKKCGDKARKLIYATRARPRRDSQRPDLARRTHAASCSAMRRF